MRQSLSKGRHSFTSVAVDPIPGDAHETLDRRLTIEPVWKEGVLGDALCPQQHSATGRLQCPQKLLPRSS
jgi:hypothetical protein